MSDLNIALIVEGPTDRILIQAALEAMFGSNFRLTQLQPEATRPDLGAGWGGVLKWCREFRRRGFPSLETDPTLEFFDVVVLHLDADVAGKSYADCGAEIVQEAARHGWLPLPCEEPCPPAAATAEKVIALLLSWLQIADIGPKTVFCVPSKAVEAWLAAACLPAKAPLLQRLECRTDLEKGFGQLPLHQRIRKSTRDYREKAAFLTKGWQEVRGLCQQAEAFHRDLDRWSAPASPEQAHD